MAFAPRDNPKIALSVYVENAGAGGEWAAPIAGLLVEKYVRDVVQSARTALVGWFTRTHSLVRSFVTVWSSSTRYTLVVREALQTGNGSKGGL